MVGSGRDFLHLFISLQDGPQVELLKDDWSLSSLHVKTESSVGAYLVFPPGNPLLEVFKALNCCWGHLNSVVELIIQNRRSGFHLSRKVASSTLFRYWEISLNSQNFYQLSGSQMNTESKDPGWPTRVVGVGQSYDPLSAPLQTPMQYKEKEMRVTGLQKSIPLAFDSGKPHRGLQDYSLKNLREVWFIFNYPSSSSREVRDISVLMW